MSYGADRWRVGEQMAAEGSHRSARAMRFYALAKMVEAAEIAARTGDKDESPSTCASCKHIASA